MIASLVWDRAPNVTWYVVMRSVGAGPPAELGRMESGFPLEFRDVVADPRVTYSYSIKAIYEDSTFNTSPAVAFTSPPARNPTNFTAKHLGDGTVAFDWDAMPGAKGYRMDGPGFPANGPLLSAPSVPPCQEFSVCVTTRQIKIVQKIPGGMNSYKLTAMYEGNFADFTTPAEVTVIVRVLPPHNLPWLSKSNGPGQFATVQMPRMTQPVCNPIFWLICAWETDPPSLMEAYDPSRVSGFELRANTDGPMLLPVWLGANADPALYPGVSFSLWNDPGQDTVEAVYGNAVDLGVGRRSSCFQTTRGGSTPGVHTVCYASAHGIPPGKPGFNDPVTITTPGTPEDRLLTMVIKKDPTGSVFLLFRPQRGYKLSPTVALDTEGDKYLPHVCLSCHGGKYNSTTRKVDGASFLPLDPGLLAFASPEAQAAQEERLRKINAMIVASAPQSAVAAYIRGLYGNSVSVPGTLAKADYVPQGWAQQSGFYRTLVKPYCAMCHLAAPPSWNFASWDNFNENAAIIKAAVCSAHTMPHGELQYKAFWTKDTGPVYLPGLLATTLVENWPKPAGAQPSCP